MKWLLQNLRRRAVFALQHPAYTVNALTRELTLADEKFIARIAGVPARQVRTYMNEPISTPEFAGVLRAGESRLRSVRIDSADLFAKKILTQYAAVRALRPDVIVETGIANGVSSAYLLLALKKNGRGRLHSVGLADPAFLPSSAPPGWLVPDWLREPWRVYLGDAKSVLAPLLDSLGAIDVFIHDSLHSYEHMLWEFDAAYPSLRAGGLLIADDALWNDAFRDFAAKMGNSDFAVLHGVGFLRKRLP